MLVTLLLPFTIAMILLSLGLGLTVADFKRVLTSPRAVSVGIIGQLAVLPLLALGLAAGLELRAELAVGLVLIAACPGGAHSNLFTNLARGDTALSVTLTALSGVATIVTIPLWMGVAANSFAAKSALGESLRLPIGATILQLVVVIGLPLVIGMGIRHRWPMGARRAEKIVKALAFTLLALIVVGAVSRQLAQVMEFVAEVGVAVLALNLAGLTAGFIAARAAQLPGRQQLTIALEVGVQNSALAVGLAMAAMGRTDVAVPAIVYSLLVYATSALLVVLGRRLFDAEPDGH